MTKAVGDSAVIDFDFHPGLAPVEGAFATTWDELLHRRFTDDCSSFVETRYALTPRGWVIGTLAL